MKPARTAPVRRARPAAAIGAAASAVGVHAFLLALAAIGVFPLAWIVLSSFKTNREILSSALGLPSSFGFTNYASALSMVDIARPMLNSLAVSLSAVLLNGALALTAAYVLTRFRNRATKAAGALLSFGILIPVNCAILPVKFLMRGAGLENSLAGLVVLYAALGIPIAVMILSVFLLTVPLELDESAVMDGAGHWRILLSIILPLSQGALASVAIWQFIGNWNEFMFALLLITSEANRTLQLAIQFFVGKFSFDYGALFAAMTIISVPPVVLFAVFQERVIEGLTAGAVKG